jgi:hypothetical protein
MKAWAGAVALTGMLGCGAALADGNALIKECAAAVKSMDDAAAKPAVGNWQLGHCSGIIEGVMRTMVILNNNLTADFKVCFPEGGITNGQALRIVDKYLHDNPAKLNEDATFLTMLAFYHAYPCK